MVEDSYGYESSHKQQAVCRSGGGVFEGDGSCNQPRSQRPSTAICAGLGCGQRPENHSSDANQNWQRIA